MKITNAVITTPCYPAGPKPTSSTAKIVGWLKSSVDLEKNNIAVSPGKQQDAAHADKKMTKHYQEGHTETEILYLEVGADSAF
ncbi:hypothetical protein [Pseudomonas chlororaphis]|uniref:hypothetical protein n=1 Tax=Pseudomonas chlororaphis TaxID=587753 RepID=UPI001CF4D19F|nr:hypothetical protein [Pseudomonas chlororaphis]UCR85633.1 hypothetical protein K9V45_05780 [Pseudomonas chlororaphis]UQS92550.1 hypothetical protein M5C90_16005 [Pseudomonas chlororaphis subsp. piscium]